MGQGRFHQGLGASCVQPCLVLELHWAMNTGKSATVSCKGGRLWAVSFIPTHDSYLRVQLALTGEAGPPSREGLSQGDLWNKAAPFQTAADYRVSSGSTGSKWLPSSMNHGLARRGDTCVTRVRTCGFGSRPRHPLAVTSAELRHPSVSRHPDFYNI